MVSVLLVIRSVDFGGQEQQLLELVSRLDQSLFDLGLVTFYGGGLMRKEFESVNGLKVFSLGKKSRWDLGALWRLWRLVMRMRPQIIVGYMPTEFLTTFLVGKATGTKLVWVVAHGSIDDPGIIDWPEHFSFQAGAFLSRFTDLIVVNSNNGYRYCVSEGYHGHKMAVIVNGIDTEYFKPQREGGRLLRRHWGIRDDVSLIGLVAGSDSRKDHATFLRAAAVLAGLRPDARFACIGCTPEELSPEARRLASSPPLRELVKWPGIRRDMATVYGALDLFTLSSSSEGLSNATAEAMACCVPCVVTDAGDAADLLGGIWPVIAPRNPQALAAGWQKVLEMPAIQRDSLCRRAREVIVSKFSLEGMVDKTAKVLLDLDNRTTRHGPA